MIETLPREVSLELEQHPRGFRSGRGLIAVLSANHSQRHGKKRREAEPTGQRRAPTASRCEKRAATLGTADEDFVGATDEKEECG